jgi:hypothetical protein
MKTVAFTNEQVAALKTMQRMWPKERIVLIGASALGHFIDMRWRQTYDLDFSMKDANWNPGGCVSKPRAVNPAATGESTTPRVSSASTEKP